MKKILLFLLLPLLSYGQTKYNLSQFDTVKVKNIAISGTVNTTATKSGLMGYATYGGTVTGGAGGTVYYVSNLDALKTAVAGNTAAIVYVISSISGNGDDACYVGNNKTIIGTPGTIISGVSFRAFTQTNIIFQNLTITNCMTDNAIILKTSTTRVWIDHCEFYSDRNHDWDLYGKPIAITEQSDFVTISWCKFHDSNLNILIGADPADATLNYLHVTVHHNWFYNNSERECANWSANVHQFNNYHVGNTGYAVGSRKSANVRVDNEYFDGCIKPFSTNFAGDPAGYVSGVSTCTTVNCGANDITTADNGFTVPYAYSTYLDPTASVPAIVKANAGVPPANPSPNYIPSNDLLGSIWELGGLLRAIPAGVAFSSFTANRVLTNQQIEWVPIYIKQYTLLTGVKTVLQTAGSYTGNNFNGVMLYSQHLGNLTLMGYSSGAANTWQATANTLITLPFNTVQSVAPGLYYIAILYCRSAETTAPKIYASVDYNQTLWNIFDLTNSNRLYGMKTGVLTPPSPVATSTIVTNTNAIPFVAVY